LSESRIRIMRCKNGHYTLKTECPECGESTYPAAPPKIKEKYAKQRRDVLYN